MRKTSLISIFLFSLSCVYTYPTLKSKVFSVTLFELRETIGNHVEVPGGKCASIDNYPSLNNSVGSINVKKGCVNLYTTSKRCEGTHLVAKPGIHGLKNLKIRLGKDETIQSVGPCLETCHPNHIELLESTYTNTSVILFNNQSWTGLNETINLKRNQCIQIPHNLKNSIGSMKIERKVCVEVYERPSCKGSSQQFRGSSGNTLNDLGGTWGKYSHSISLCGYNCIFKSGVASIAEDVAEETEATTVYSKGKSSEEYYDLED